MKTAREESDRVFALLILFIIIGLLMSWLSGCSTPRPLSEVAACAAHEGTRAYLTNHPEHRVIFEEAVRGMMALRKGQAISPLGYVELMSVLPTNALVGRTGAVYVVERPGRSSVPERVVVWDGKKAAVADEATLRALASGLKSGLAPLPPSVPTKRDVRAVKLGGTNFVPLGPLLTLPNDPPRSTVIPSTLELITNEPPLLSLLALSFDVTPEGCYGIDHRPAPGAAWQRVTTFTNAISQGSTTWSTSWTQPAGEWRVIQHNARWQ